MTVLERRSTCGLSWYLWAAAILEMVVVGLVLSGKVWQCLIVKTTPEKVSGNLQVSNLVTTPGVMAKLFPYTCLWPGALLVLQNILF